jgi:membrane fusion protein (multidrug efflux system)
MSDFTRSAQFLHSERGTGTAWFLASALVLLAAWLLWATFANVWLYEVTTEARVELDSATYPIETPLLGRVTKADLRVGEHVHRGDVLVEIDSMPQQLQLDQARVESQGLDAQLAALRNQIEAEQSARVREQLSAGLSAREAQDRMRAAQEPAQFAEGELARIHKLRDEKLISIRDVEKAESDARRLREEFTALQVAASRPQQDQAARDRERDVRIARLQGETATLQAQRSTLHAEATRLTYEIERRRIRAPIDGTIGEALALRAGAVVSEGDSLGSIVPAGELRVVAQYPVQAAFGRLHTGQRATLRLDGFAWAEFGTVSATVARVAQEARDGKVRVELTLTSKSSFHGELEHGMPGSLEIAVEQVSPLHLLLRTAGQALARPP